MTVQCQFVCRSVEHHVGTSVVRLDADISSQNGNKSWSTYTPSGSISLTITHQPAIDQFKPGKKYAVVLKEIAEVTVA